MQISNILIKEKKSLYKVEADNSHYTQFIQPIIQIYAAPPLVLVTKIHLWILQLVARKKEIKQTACTVVSFI